MKPLYGQIDRRRTEPCNFCGQQLGQNCGNPGRHAVADVLESSPFGHNADVLAQMMREADDS